MGVDLLERVDDGRLVEFDVEVGFGQGLRMVSLAFEVGVVRLDVVTFGSRAISKSS